MKTKIVVALMCLSLFTLFIPSALSAAPDILAASESPEDGATNVDTYPTLQVEITTSTNDTTVYFMYLNGDTWEEIGNTTGANYSREVISQATSFDDYDRTYNWSVNVSDEGGWTNESYLFTLESAADDTVDTINLMIPVIFTFMFIGFLFAAVGRVVKF
jgi:hypothetical protein